MKYKIDFVITGAMPNKGEFKNQEGEVVQYDHIKFYVEMPLATGKGLMTVEKKAFTSADFDKLFNVELPALATIEFEQVASGGKEKTNVIGIEFKKQSPKTVLGASV